MWYKWLRKRGSLGSYEKNIHTVHTIWNYRLGTDSSQSAQQINTVVWWIRNINLGSQSFKSDSQKSEQEHVLSHHQGTAWGARHSQSLLEGTNCCWAGLACWCLREKGQHAGVERLFVLGFQTEGEWSIPVEWASVSKVETKEPKDCPTSL